MVLAYEIYPGVIADPAEAQVTVASIRNWIREYMSGEYRATLKGMYIFEIWRHSAANISDY